MKVTLNQLWKRRFEYRKSAKSYKLMHVYINIQSIYKWLSSDCIYMWVQYQFNKFLHPNALNIFSHDPPPPPCLRGCRSLAHRVAAEVFSVDAAARTCLRMDTLDAWETCPYVTILCHWTADGNKGNLKMLWSLKHWLGPVKVIMTSQ